MQKFKFYDDGGHFGCHSSLEPEPPDQSVLYLASDADALIEKLTEQNRKLRRFAGFAKGTSDFAIAKAAREVLELVGPETELNESKANCPVRVE